MNILELEQFKIEDAINFHDEYNPWLFDGDKLKPTIKRQLETIADDFVEFMGIPGLAIEDIIITGSNVAYTYTSHSDLDLHLLVDFAKLPNSDVYKELFNAKKSLYNDTYEITIRDIPVELYVQDTAQPHVSLGEYSLYKDMFTRIPTKKRANLDEISAASKFERLEEMCLLALKSKDIDKVKHVLDIIKRYRQAGLDTKGEFGPENLAFKAIRSKGYFQALFNHRNKLRAEQLSLEEELLRRTFEESIGLIREGEKLSKPTPTVDDLSMDYDVSKETVLKQLDSGIKIELEHTNDREIAREIALDHLSEKLDYYELLAKFEKDNMSESLPTLDTKYDRFGMPDYSSYYKFIDQLVKEKRSRIGIVRYLQNEFDELELRDARELVSRWEVTHRRKLGMNEASGYIPSEAQKDDPRWSYALTKDVRPDTMKKGAKAMGLGDISRAGIPPLLRPGKKSKKSNPNADFGKGIY